MTREEIIAEIQRAPQMTLKEIISSLIDNALDRESSISTNEPDSIFVRDAIALRQAAAMLEQHQIALQKEGKVAEAYGVRASRKILANSFPMMTGHHATVTYSDFRRIRKGVEDWSRERGIHNAEPAKQMLKLTEEVGELAGAIARNHRDDIADAIGDILVVLTILCQRTGFDIEKCFDTAYQTIKGRKGKTVNGVFVKEADLNGG